MIVVSPENDDLLLRWLVGSRGRRIALTLGEHAHVQLERRIEAIVTMPPGDCPRLALLAQDSLAALGLLAQLDAQILGIAPGDDSLINRDGVVPMTVVPARPALHAIGEMNEFVGDGYLDADIRHVRFDEDQVAVLDG